MILLPLLLVISACESESAQPEVRRRGARASGIRHQDVIESCKLIAHSTGSANLPSTVDSYKAAFNILIPQCLRQSSSDAPPEPSSETYGWAEDGQSLPSNDYEGGPNAVTIDGSANPNTIDVYYTPDVASSSVKHTRLELLFNEDSWSGLGFFPTDGEVSITRGKGEARLSSPTKIIPFDTLEIYVNAQGGPLRMRLVMRKIGARIHRYIGAITLHCTDLCQQSHKRPLIKAPRISVPDGTPVTRSRTVPANRKFGSAIEQPSSGELTQLAETAMDLESRLKSTEASLAKCQGELGTLRDLKGPSRGMDLPAGRATKEIDGHFWEILKGLEEDIMQKDNELRGFPSSDSGGSLSDDDDMTGEEERKILSQANPAEDAMISCRLLTKLLTLSIDNRDLIYNGYACYDGGQVNPCLALEPLDAWTNAVIHLIQDKCDG